ncbi:MAG TPA: flagellar hook-basal body complex protein FliE [Pyrinomonadaceae bacterium]|nr:flagellar hook-basal body complex protein FliE [Pyrinomonadaceae bacterium]
MNINGFSPQPILPLTQTNQTSAATDRSFNGDFGSLVQGAVDSIDGVQKGAEQEIAKAVTGESPDLHKTIISLQSSDLKFQLGLQVRNKLIGAYEEIMRMQV